MPAYFMILKNMDTSSFHKVGVNVLHGRDLSDLAPEVEVRSSCHFIFKLKRGPFSAERYFLGRKHKIPNSFLGYGLFESTPAVS